jgi:demethylphylloquinone reductase
LGGGFGGLYTAIKLEGLVWPKGTKPKVTLVDKSDRFTFKPLLYELLTGAATEQEVAPSFSDLLAPYPAIDFRQAAIAAVQPAAHVDPSLSMTATTTDSDSDDTIYASTTHKANGGTILLSTGETIPYDWLVLALGSETATFGIPGVKQHAFPFATYEDATRLLRKLSGVEAKYRQQQGGRGAGKKERGSIVVVGGGYAGVETAAVIAERLKTKGLSKSINCVLLTADGNILSSSPAGQREAAEKVLDQAGVEVKRNLQVTELSAITDEYTSSSDADDADSSTNGSTNGSASRSTDSGVLMKLKESKSESSSSSLSLRADVVIWSAGSTPAPKAQKDTTGLSLPFPSNSRGATCTEPTLRVMGEERVFALGDVAVQSNNNNNNGTPSTTEQQQPPLPATAQVAFQQADYVAWNIWAGLNKKPLLSFSYQHLGDMMSLGSLGGAVSLPFSLPPPLAAAARSGPLGDLLNLAGIKVGSSLENSGEGGAGVTLEGPLAAALRRGAYLYRQPTDQQRLKVGVTWVQLAADLAASFAGNGSRKK